MRFFLLAVIFIISAINPALARPIAYPGGWSIMTMNDVDMNAVHLFYSPTAKYSFGLNHEYMRDPKSTLDALQGNYLLKRWNMPTSQANIYLKAGAGAAYGSGDVDPAVYTGVTADWENRRFLTSYENRFLWADETEQSAKHTARFGVAPYLGDYGDLHTWLMLQADYDAGEQDSFSVTPLVRLFKGTTLVEAGYNLDQGLLFNVMLTY
jgi:hypothetical protein